MSAQNIIAVLPQVLGIVILQPEPPVVHVSHIYITMALTAKAQSCRHSHHLLYFAGSFLPVFDASITIINFGVFFLLLLFPSTSFCLICCTVASLTLSGLTSRKPSQLVEEVNSSRRRHTPEHWFYSLT